MSGVEAVGQEERGRHGMSLAGITREGVLRAVAEFDRLGRDRFLRKYGFGQAKQYFLTHEGQHYDSKAIAGAAHGFDHSAQGPLRSADFSGGEATVRKRLIELNFRVGRLPRAADWTPSPKGSYTSDRLQVGHTYTREQ